MSKKNNKAERVIEMLKAGESVTFIKRMLAVSESYIYMLKKQLAEGADTPRAIFEKAYKQSRSEAQKNGFSMAPDFLESSPQDKAKTFTPEEVGVSEEAFIEAALAASQGKGKPKSGEFIQADTNVDAILDARGSNYGDFLSHAEVTQQLKNVMMAHLIKKQKTLIVDQQESLEMIFHKIGRILNGNPDYVDSWLDIAGYATLVADRLQGKTR